jgi:multiple sugar transport system substrate-binding protein
MSDTSFNRRKFLETSAGAAAVAGVGTGSALFAPLASAQNVAFKPEKDAKLRVLRWSRFVQGDIDAYMVNVKKFTEKTGIEVRVDNEGWEDVRPKRRSRQHRRRPRHHPVDQRRCEPLSRQAARRHRRRRVHRQEVRRLVPGRPGVPEAGRQEVARPAARRGRLDDGLPREPAEGGRLRRLPKTTDDFLKMAKAVAAKGTPGGMALGNATGDGLWCNWLVWAFGGKLVDANNKVVIDSPETLKALEYGKELYATFIPGTLSWLDPNNNKAFLDGQISYTNNGISIYVAAKNSTDPKVKEMASTSSTRRSPSGRSACPRSRTCSSTR